MTPGHGIQGPTTLDAGAAGTDDCLVANIAIVRAQGSCDGHLHVRPTLLADRSYLRSQSVDSPRRSHRSLGHIGSAHCVAVAIPVAGVAALLVYNARGSRYAQETDERHTVAATVLESETDAAGSTVVQARWPVAAGERTGPLQLTREAKVGQHIEIWVDTGGDPVAPPTPTWHAVGDAYGTALAILLCMGVTMTSFVTGVRSRLDRACDAQWDREIRCLQDDGGRTNQH